ncbi:MAG: GntR family transcriptional regulator [Nitrospirae bacterium]|nr:GntR family transcriptional regulator [Nitrospirota bacterium]
MGLLRRVDRGNQEKLYLQLAGILRERIESGEWGPSTRIPTEEDLCRLYGVSKITVRQAEANLAAEGLLQRAQGKGTFVVERPILPALAMRTRLTEDLLGKEVGAETRVIRQAIREPDEEVRGYLQLPEGEQVIGIQRVRKVGRMPVIFEKTYVPLALFPKLLDENLEGKSLYALLQQQAPARIGKVVETVGVATLAGQEADRLRVPDRTAGLLVQRLLVSAEGRPLAYTRFLIRGDRYKFQMEFERVR